MIPKYRLVKRIVLIVPLIFSLLQATNAQDKDQSDSTRTLSKDLDNATDTVQEPPPGEQTIDPVYADSPVVKQSIYFLEKQSQENGGGPDSLQMRKLPDSAAKKLRADEDFWYVNYVFKKEKKKEEERTSFTESTIFQTILWLVIIGGFAAFVIIYLSNSNIGLFRRAGKAVSNGEEGDMVTDNIFEINYSVQIDRAINSGNYRLAVRLMFLRVLKNLSDKKVIQYKHDRTNFDYLLQLYSTKYYNDFFRLTRNYEYSWYGQFALEREKFDIIKSDFESFDRNMNYR